MIVLQYNNNYFLFGIRQRIRIFNVSGSWVSDKFLALMTVLLYFQSRNARFLSLGTQWADCRNWERKV
uniref:Uncharacterized protein n=1 Tax=Spironucleus salmonicida TaxID=348837 RepID=V6LVA3_9EUKA|eukprot:EST44719.1 Hypothetical protein SS50377_15432 [Spironucleus salmonicida]